MSDYTPTTDAVREGYAYIRGDGANEYREAAFPQFDRWLAAHDAEVAATALAVASAEELIGVRSGLALACTAWTEGANTMLLSVNAHQGGPWAKPVNPYSGHLLRAIAETRCATAGRGNPEPSEEPALIDGLTANQDGYFRILERMDISDHMRRSIELTKRDMRIANEPTTTKEGDL